MSSVHESQAECGQRETGPPIRAQLAITPDTASRCRVVRATEKTHDVTHQMKPATGENREFDECHTELSTGTDDTPERSYITSEVHAKCICPVLAEHDCIPDVKGVRSGTLIVGLTVPRQSVLREILTALKAIDATVSVEWIVHGDRTDGVVEMDASTITEKQREALEVALDMGYYETPRETTLGTLSDRLDISKSAVSQRLNAAETKLVKAFSQ